MGMTASAESLRHAEDLQSTLAGSTLSAAMAKLYSQHTRIRAGREGLRSWTTEEASARLDDAILLIDAGLLLRSAKRDGYRPCLRRAGEVLEWLAPSDHPDIDGSYILTSAAAYQLAGYPARAHSLLKTPFPEGYYSNTLRSFL